MFERYVSSIILTLANKYIKNLNASELRMSLWGAPRAPSVTDAAAHQSPPCWRAGGAVTLNNVELRTEVLQEEVESPFIFKRIFIQELKLNIPWASLRYQPAKVSSRANRIIIENCVAL